MEAKSDGARPGRTPAAPSPVELVVHNGRQKGARRPLTGPLLLIGRGTGADLRLNVEGVAPLHCCIVNGADGVFLRALPGGGDVMVNGQPAPDSPLRHGDLLAIGPFQFQVCINGPTTPQRLADLQAKHSHEKDALRIQAAAVAAQQAALAEEEAKLEQRRTALKQQEDQLAAHLEEKRQRLVEVRDQSRAALAALRSERAAHEAKVKETERELTQARAQLTDGQQRLQSDRERMATLLARVKRRWAKQLAAERNVTRQREEEVMQQERQLEHERDRLQKDKTTHHQARLRFNGEAELGRRQLQAEWQAFRQEQAQDEERREQQEAELRRRTRELDERHTALVQAQQELDGQKLLWQDARLHLEKEVEGLDNRIRNYRRKIAELERDVAQAQAQAAAIEKAVEAAVVKTEKVEGEAFEALAGAAADASASVTPAAATAEQPSAPPAPPAPPVPVPVKVELPRIEPPAEDPAVHERLAHLERLSGEIADQRLHLVEQCQRFIEAQHRWHQERDAAAGELEELGKRLHARELDLSQRERALEASEGRLQQLHEQARALRGQLEAWQARLTAREATWTAERDRLLTDVQAREKIAADRLAALTDLHQRWMRRRRRELQWLQHERTAFAQLRQECAALRQDYLKRGGVLEREQRMLAEQALALEEFQQELIGQAAQPASAARRLDKLRQRWAALSSAGQKALTEQRQVLEKEAAEIQAFHTRLKAKADKVAAQEAELSRQLTAWEHAQVLAQKDMAQMRTDLHVSQAMRDRYEQQANELREEVERLARLLLDDGEAGEAPVTKAA